MCEKKKKRKKKFMLAIKKKKSLFDPKHSKSIQISQYYYIKSMLF